MNLKPTSLSAGKAGWEVTYNQIFGKTLWQQIKPEHPYKGEMYQYTEASGKIKSFIASELARERERLAGEIGKYHELIMAVENKYEGETRHETALRSIKGTECGSGQSQFTQAAKKVRKDD